MDGEFIPEPRSGEEGDTGRQPILSHNDRSGAIPLSGTTAGALNERVFQRVPDQLNATRVMTGGRLVNETARHHRARPA